jgi:hypothetical protein
VSIATKLRAIAPHLTVTIAAGVGVLSGLIGNVTGAVMSIAYLGLYREFIEADAGWDRCLKLAQRATDLLEADRAALAAKQP